MIEIWFDCKVNDKYMVSTFGRIKNKVFGNILKPNTKSDGYQRVQLSSKKYYIHRLIAMTFLKNPEDKPTVNHIDGDRTNNKLSNLIWATHKEQKQNKAPCSLTERQKEVNRLRNRRNYLRKKGI